MTVKDLIKILEFIDCDVPIVVEDEQGNKEASYVSLFINTKGEVAAVIE